MADQQSQEYMRGRKTLELNPRHPIIQALSSTASSNPGEAKASLALQLCIMQASKFGLCVVCCMLSKHCGMCMPCVLTAFVYSAHDCILLAY